MKEESYFSKDRHYFFETSMNCPDHGGSVFHYAPECNCRGYWMECEAGTTLEQMVEDGFLGNKSYYDHDKKLCAEKYGACN
jgi:hypothetical protein